MLNHKIFLLVGLTIGALLISRVSVADSPYKIVVPERPICGSESRLLMDKTPNKKYLIISCDNHGVSVWDANSLTLDT